ncbi:MAG: hypothetical protein U0103_16460 [Candidatus Obscuribacterales bacterium]
MVPVPQVSSVDELTRKIWDRCNVDGEHTVSDQPTSIDAAFELERDKLLPLPGDCRRCFESIESGDGHAGRTMHSYHPRYHRTKRRPGHSLIEHLHPKREGKLRL